MFLLELARNLAALARELADAAVAHLAGRAIDAAVSSPLTGHTP